VTATAKPERIKRRQLAGVLLRPLGHGYWGVEQTGDGFSLLGKGGMQIHFADLAALPKTKRVLGFQAATFALKNGSEMSVVGIGRDDAAHFSKAAHDAIRRYFGEKIDHVRDELQTLAKAIERLENPRRYPSACLLQPFFERASKIMEGLPAVIPDDAVADDKRQLLNKVIAFQENAQSMREDAAERFVETELEEMKEFFDGIESNPLTPEQRLAVIADEDATLVLAGAGSGKTSVIVAKAAYLIKRNIRQPEEILLMAFGKDAAAEMATRC
jgi:DNA helicase IV